MTVLSESWHVQCLCADGRWCEAGGGPDEDSARDVARSLWARPTVRGVRLVRSERAVVQEKTR